MRRAQRPDEPLPRERADFRALKAQIAELDLVVRGSLVRVRSRCGRPGCACATDADARHGPYVRWTRKVAARTVSIPLRSEEVPLFERWLANSRRLDQLVARMHDLGLRVADRVLKARTKA